MDVGIDVKDEKVDNGERIWRGLRIIENEWKIKKGNKEKGDKKENERRRKKKIKKKEKKESGDDVDKNEKEEMNEDLDKVERRMKRMKEIGGDKERKIVMEKWIGLKMKIGVRMKEDNVVEERRKGMIIKKSDSRSEEKED